MPTTKAKTIWPTRVGWPRRSEGMLPALAGGPVAAPYVSGRSRFVLSPLHLSLDQLIFLISAALLAIGLIMVQSADARIHSGDEHWVREAFATKNFLHAGLALLAMGLVWRLDYRRVLGPSLWRSPATYLVVLTLVFLGLVLATPLGKEINGAKRWLGLGPLSFQPSELAKLGLVLFISAYAVHRAEALRELFRGFVPLVGIFGVVLLLVVKEDFGTTVLIAVVCFVLLAMAGCRWWHLLLLLPPAGGGAYVMLHDPMRVKRLLAYLDPYADPRGAGYHPLQSLYTIVSGGFWGRGLGNGIQKQGFLPEDNTDFIFAVICEELGFFGALMVLALFALFVLAGWRIASRCQNLFGKMVAFGITAIFGLQAAINIAVVTVTVPTKGIALPLISSGGTGWIMMAVAIGVLMSIERVNRREAVELARSSAAPPSWGFPVVMSSSANAASPAAGPAPQAPPATGGEGT